MRRRRRIKKIASFVLAGVFVVVFPIYPASGDFLYSRTGGTFHGNIDESTILWEGEDFDATIDVSPSGFIDVNVAIEQTRDWGDRDDIFIYTVQSGDTLGALAQDFDLDISTIRANNGVSWNNIRVGQKLTIIPEDGLLHTVVQWDGIEKLAQTYQIEVSEILRANKLEKVIDLQIGESLILPGAKPIVIPGAYPGENARCYNSTRGGQRCSVNGNYQMVKTTPGGRGFVWGHCTYYVAQHWPVGWRGHARYWFENAKKAGYPTGQIARPGAIIVWYGPGYNLAYGHVGIVTQVQWETIIVKDMNYAGLNVVTTRKESIHNRYILGYIYQK